MFWEGIKPNRQFLRLSGALIICWIANAVVYHNAELPVVNGQQFEECKRIVTSLHSSNCSCCGMKAQFIAFVKLLKQKWDSQRKLIINAYVIEIYRPIMTRKLTEFVLLF